ncbi:MAG: hypothetical protein AAF654_00360 [Myxococcota bacterium]
MSNLQTYCLVLIVAGVGCGRVGFSLVDENRRAEESNRNPAESFGGGSNPEPCDEAACGSGICILNECAPAGGWFGVAGSEPGPWELEFDSALSPGTSITGNSSQVDSVAMTLDGQQRPVLVWRDSTNGTAQTYLKAFDGTEWVELGGLSARQGGLSNASSDVDEPCVATAPDSRLYVGFGRPSSSEGSAGYTVLQFDGTVWAPVGDSETSELLAADGAALLCSIVVGDDNLPVFAFEKIYEGVRQIYVAKLDESEWQPLGAGAASAGGISNATRSSGRPVLALDDCGAPMVTWAQNDDGVWQSYARFYDGIEWGELGTSASTGGVSASVQNSFSQQIVVDNSGAPVLAWVDGAGADFEVHVRRWDGDGWSEITPGSARLDGISGSPNTSASWVALSRDTTGHVVAAWEERQTSERWEIFVRRLQGDQWQELSGSASGGGISNSTGRSQRPTMAVSSQSSVPCVAWTEANHVALRCHGPAE